jgi:hypothetical protein
MTQHVYPNQAAAAQACRQYVEEFYALQEQYGVTETCDDSCVQTYIHVQFYDESGAIQQYTHW